MVLVMVFSTLSLWLGMEDTLNSRLRSDIDVRSASTDVSALEAAVDETLRQAGASREHLEQQEETLRILGRAIEKLGSTKP